MIALSCPHGDIRDCHACLAAAHRSAIRLASADWRAARGTGDTTATSRLHDRQMALAGFLALLKAGIVAPVTIPGDAKPPQCACCGAFARENYAPCPNRCSVRFQPPEVR